MKFYFLASLLLFVCSFSEAAKKTPRLTPFQKNIQECLEEKINFEEVRDLESIYQFISNRYLLITSKVLGREVLYKIKEENRKLKMSNGKIKLYKFSDDEEQILTEINNDVRQNSLTSESYMAQLLINARISYDWMEVSESRSESTKLVLTREDQSVKNLIFTKEKQHKKLECRHLNDSDICSCLFLK